MDTREVLRPYKKQRLGFEGVLIDIIEPNRRNGYNFGLVFASVYAPNEKIELDHAVIQMNMTDFKKAGLNLYERYYFTASIASYYKTAKILGAIALQENLMLQNINLNKLRVQPESELAQPTMHVMTRIDNIMLCKGELHHTKEGLLETVNNTPNDGSVERFINDCTTYYQQAYINGRDIERTLYA